MNVAASVPPITPAAVVTTVTPLTSTSGAASLSAGKPTAAAGTTKMSGENAGAGAATGTAPPTSLADVSANPMNDLPTESTASAGAGTDPINVQQLLGQVAYGVQTSYRTGQSMQLRLSPPELGALQIDVSIKNGALTAQLRAESPEARKALEDSLPQLKQSLSDQGMSIDRIDVLPTDPRGAENQSAHTGGSFGQGGGTGQGSDSGQAGIGFQPAEPAPAPTPAPAGRPAINSTRQLDVQI